jgi:hypothetical protein
MPAAAAQEGADAVHLAGPPVPVRPKVIKVPVVASGRGRGPLIS